MVDNPNRTVYDMSSYFYSVFSPKVKVFAFCYPSEYNDSYLDSRSVPKEISYADFVKGIKEIETTFNAKHRFSKETKEALELKLDKEIKETDHSAKKKYLKKASIYIKCLRLSETVKKIREYDDINCTPVILLGTLHICIQSLTILQLTFFNLMRLYHKPLITTQPLINNKNRNLQFLQVYQSLPFSIFFYLLIPSQVLYLCFLI